MPLQAVNYKCTFCSRTFKRRSWYERHMCDKKQRFLDANNIMTIRAHRLFNYWQKRNGFLRRGKTKSMEEFCKSPLYGCFIRLANFVTNEYVVSGFKYLDWLIDNKVPEVKWCNPRGLDEYHEYLRESEDPNAQAETSCKNIRVWASDHGLEVPVQFFTRITPGQALNMVRENKLSPWLLFGYDPCVEHLTSRIVDTNLFHDLNDHINIAHWMEKCEDKDSIAVITQLCDERLDVAGTRNT